MEKKPITSFLKVMSILILIQSVLGVLVSLFAVFLAPAVEEAAEGDTGFMWVTLVVGIVCMVINIVLAVMALQHKKIDLVYKVSLFTLVISVVFSSTGGSGASDYISVLIGAVIPALFCVAAFKQNKADQAQ